MIKTRLVRLLSHTKKYIVWTIVWQWIALLGQIVSIFAIGRFIDEILAQTVTKNNVIMIFGILVTAIVIRFVCDEMATRASFAASVDVKRILREKIYEKLLRLGASYREKTATSEVVQMSAEGVEQLEIYFGKYLPQLFYSLLAPITLFVILSRISLKASLVLLVCVPLIPISIVAVQKIAKRLLSKYWGLYTTLGDSFLENLQGMTTLKIYQADEQKAVEMDEEAQNFRKITMKVLTMQLNSTSVMDIVAYGGAAVGMIAAITEFINGNITFGGTLVILLLASEFFIPLRLLGSFFHIAMNGMAASDKIFKLLDLEEPKQGSKTLPESSLSVELKDVHFSYEKDREILKGISMEFPKGSFISLVGESGCGKSTISAILTGRNKGYEGKVQINGYEITDIKEDELMSHITTIRHNSYLFKGTVEDNLKMAKPDASNEEMEEVLKQVNLLAFLQTQNGLETKISERGENFSGGQKQRLCLARALLADTPIYIFDEATSNIDMESEEMIMDVIRKLSKTKTILFISHRLANVVDSDRIYMLEEGIVKEAGTHEELMKMQGIYHKLYESQKELESYASKHKAHDQQQVRKAV